MLYAGVQKHVFVSEVSIFLQSLPLLHFYRMSLLKFVAGKYGLYALLNRAFGVFLDNRVFL
jgi:hypothetical protein